MSFRFPAAFFLCWVISAYPALAQSVIDPAQEFLKEQERKKKLQQLEKSQAGQELQTNKIKDEGPDKTCFAIKSINLSGVTLIKSWNVNRITKTYLKKCMGQKAIKSLMQSITNEYIKNGYITSRVYIPKQDLKSGILKILVIEGTIEEIQYQQLEGKKKTVKGPFSKMITAFPQLKGAILNLRDLEQGLDQINRLSSSSASVDLLPGKKPGGSIILITEKKTNRFRAYVGFDNNGSESTGENRARASIEMDDLLWINDSWNMSVLAAENTNILTAGLSIPYGRWTLSASGSYSENQQDLTLTSLLYNQTASTNVKLKRLVFRDAKTKINVSGSLSHYWNSRYINASQLTPIYRGAGRLSLGGETHGNGSVTSLDFGFGFGAPWWFSKKPEGAGNGSPNYSFKKVDGTFYWIKAWKWGRIIVNAHGQFSKDELLSPDQLSIGGWDTVRGYHGAEAAGDKGGYWRNELVLNLPEMPKASLPHSIQSFYKKHKTKLQPYLFFDAGKVWNNATETDAAMMGLGGGARLSTERLSLEASIGAPLLDIENIETDEWQAYINLTFKVF